jgi:pyruvate kinase
VQRPEDMAEAREIVGAAPPLLAKLEKPAAMDLEAIVEARTRVMVARGDLGVEMPPEEVPGPRSASCAPPPARQAR